MNKSAKWIVFGFFLALIGLVARPCLATDPASFSILSPGGKFPELALNDVLKLKIDGDSPVDPKKAKLRINDNLLGVEPVWLADVRQLNFTLKRTEGTDNNRAMWSSLLGSPFEARTTTTSINLVYADKPLTYASAPKPGEAPEPKITMVKFDPGWLAAALGFAAAVVAGICYLGLTTPILRDAGLVTQIPPMQRPFSLGRCQMAVWFCLILGSFLFIYVILWDLNSINAESFVLLGISASTALAAVAIDHSKDAVPSQVQANLTAMGLKTQSDVDRLTAEVRTNGSAAASTVITGATVPGNANPTVHDLWDAYRTETRNFRSDNFLRDLINDASGPTLHRFQIVIWTLVLAAIYVGLVYLKLETPTFGTNLLAVMGISGGIYLGFKIPEKQG